MRSLYTLATSFHVLATCAGLGRGHQQANVKSAHGGAWYEGISSRFAAITGCCAHYVIGDYFTQRHQGEACHPRRLQLGWGADHGRINLQGRRDKKMTARLRIVPWSIPLVLVR